tara:strand:+ start:5623 stop:6711 length:1089 start_codon:yes stop_codon:yes gene_type:complete
MKWNCDVISDQLPDELVNALKVLSPYPVIKVPVRQKGITAGKAQNCYWNSSIISQTFGGDVVYGWIVADEGEGDFGIYGHGCWLTPEGKLVDVTPRSGKNLKHRFFLPSDERLVLNGKVTECLRPFVFARTEETLLGALCTRARHHLAAYKNDASLYRKKVSTFSPFDIDVKPFLGRLCTFDAFPLQFFKHPGVDIPSISKELLEAFSPFIKEVDASTPKKERFDQRGSWESRIEPFLEQSFKTGKTVFELSQGLDISAVFWHGEDATWSDNRITDTPVDGISSITGETIKEIPPHQEVLAKHQVPRNRSRRKKLQRHLSKTNLTPQEFLMLSNPYLFPHPYIVRKTGFATTALLTPPVKRI